MPSVCFVGLGAAGLVCVKELREHGFDVTGIDAGKHVGGRWALDDYNNNKTDDKARHFGVWKELYMNSSRPLSEFSDYPWKRQDYADKAGVEQDFGGQYPHCSETKAYLESYVHHFDLLKEGIELGTMVESVQDESGNGWVVVTRSTTPGNQSVSRRFDFLVLCLGLHALHKNPLSVPGGSLHEYTGQKMHSSELGTLSEMDGKRVLVIGSSISGGDLASSLAARGMCKRVVNSVRHVPYVVDRFSPVSRMPLDQLMPNRMLVYFNRYLPDSVNATGLKKFVEQSFPNQLSAQATGDESLVPDNDITKAGVTLAGDYVQHVRDGRIVLKQEVQTSSDRTVVFQDGTKEEFDAVICATGYNMDLSFLPEKMQQQAVFKNPFSETLEVALYKYTLLPGWDNVAFAGQFNIIGSHFPTAEMQARYISKVFCGDIRRPSDADLMAGVERFKAFRRGGPHHVVELDKQIQEDLADELGLTPSIVSTLWNSKTLLLGPIFPCYYRTNPKLNNPKVAKQAKELFVFYLAHPEQFLQRTTS